MGTHKTSSAVCETGGTVISYISTWLSKKFLPSSFTSSIWGTGQRESRILSFLHCKISRVDNSFSALRLQNNFLYRRHPTHTIFLPQRLTSHHYCLYFHSSALSVWWCERGVALCLNNTTTVARIYTHVHQRASDFKNNEQQEEQGQ